MKRCGRVVELADHLTDCGSPIEGPRTGMGELALDVADCLATVGVESRTNHTRRRGETCILEMAQK